MESVSLRDFIVISVCYTMLYYEDKIRNGQEYIQYQVSQKKRPTKSDFFLQKKNVMELTINILSEYLNASG